MVEHVSEQVSDVIVKRIPIDALEPHPFNYNQHPAAQIAELKASLKRYKQVKPIVVQKAVGNAEHYTILAGHGITMAAQELLAENSNKYAHLADWLVAIVPQDWSILDAKGYMASDNETGRKAETDETLLAELLQEQANAGYDLASLGTDDEALRQMLEALGDEYLGSGGNQDEKPDVQFKEYDESIEDGLDTEMCQQCGKLCLRNGGKKDA